MDFYRQRWVLGFAQKQASQWAITLGSCTFYSTPQEAVTPAWRAHEECHKQQWRRHWYLGFALRYLWELATKGYNNISYEIEARAAARNITGPPA
jgi:ferric-dicitrate binding protein FerR (iron transport regulator)